MKVRWKILVSVIIGTFFLNFAIYFATESKLLPVLSHLEIEQTEKQLKFGLSEIYEMVDVLQRTTKDFAAWDDTYAYVGSPSTQYVASNLVKSTFSNYQLDFLLIVNNQGQLVFGEHYDVESDTLKSVSKDFQQQVLQEKRLWSFSGPEDFLGGALRIGDAYYLLATEPILTSNGTGPIHGALIMGMRFNQALLDESSDDWGGAFRLKPLSAEFTADKKLRDNRPLFLIKPQNDEVLQGRIRLFDLFDRPLLDLEAQFQRNIYVHGKEILETLVGWNLLICLVFAIVLYLTVDKALRSRELRQETDDRFRQLSSEFEMILNGIPNPLTLVSPDLKVLWANHAGAALLADVSPVRSGKYYASVDFISGFAEKESAVERSLVSKHDERGLAELADGRVLEEVAYPLLDESGEIVSIIRLTEDVTEASLLKREADQNSRLASIGELAAGVAHEINNPNGMILLNLGLLSDVYADLTPFLDEQYEQDPDLELGRIPYAILRKKIPYLLREMTQGGIRIKRIVEDLKGFARSDLEDTKEIVSVNDVCSAAVRLLEYQLKKATRYFSANYVTDLPAVRGHFRRLEQVVVNLLVNATQSLQDREGAIVLSTRISADANWIVIEVEDQGGGIDEDLLGRVTDPFFTTRRNEGGTGLGLSLSARIAEEHGGGLRILSTPGVGSKISLRLPYDMEEK
ncbi:MAG: ATP-binding protein [Geopsychrobacter sp.]|nr:ATP-binding protein [Geopsychrobacter sp.]